MDRANRNAPRLTRRQLIRLAAAGAIGASTSGWIETLAADAAKDPRRRKSCILLWMTGGPSQLDTFDPKPALDRYHGTSYQGMTKVGSNGRPIGKLMRTT